MKAMDSEYHDFDLLILSSEIGGPWPPSGVIASHSEEELCSDVDGSDPVFVCLFHSLDRLTHVASPCIARYS